MSTKGWIITGLVVIFMVWFIVRPGRQDGDD